MHVEKELEEQEEDIWIKTFSSALSIKNIEITNYLNCEPKFNGVFSRNSLPRIKERAYVINLDDKKKSKGTHWVSLFIDRNTAVYFDSFGIEHIPLEGLNKIKDNQLLTIYLEYKMMNILCVDFIVLLS